MKITKKIYKKALIAMENGYENVVVAKRYKYRKKLKCLFAYEDVKIYNLNDIICAYLNNKECKCVNEYDNYLINTNYHIKFSTMISNNIIPSLLKWSVDIIEARVKNIWFIGNEQPSYIYVNYNYFPGVFTYNDMTDEFVYRYENICIKLDHFDTNLMLKRIKNV
jgi:hypothetical protein